MTDGTNSTEDTLDVFIIDKGAEMQSELFSDILDDGGQTANVSGFTTQQEGLEAVSRTYGDRPDLDLVVLTGVEGNAIGSGLFGESAWSGTDTGTYVDQIKEASDGRAKIVMYTGGGKVTKQDARDLGVSGYMFKIGPIDKKKYTITAARHDIYWDMEDLQAEVMLRAAGGENINCYRTALVEMGKEMLNVSERTDDQSDYMDVFTKAVDAAHKEIVNQAIDAEPNFLIKASDGISCVARILFRMKVNPTQEFYKALGESLLYVAENFDKPNQ